MQPCVYFFLFTATLLPRTRKYCKNKEGRIDSCVGDSGGLWLIVNPNGFVVSFGVSLVLAKSVVEKAIYGNYAKVPNYISWIRRTILVE